MVEKKVRILHTAIEVFSEGGFEVASTNEIAKRAGVSKGLLFHYFGNKRELYAACQWYVLDEYIAFMAEHLDIGITDFFDRVLANLRVKMDFCVRNPSFLPIINKILYEKSDTYGLTRAEIERHLLGSHLGAALRNFFSEVDITLFRQNVNLAKLMEYTQLGLEALWLRYSAEHSESLVEGIGEYIADCEEFVGLVKFGALKPQI
ncbi:MAG: TetR/AcrR family transcriptional regulator [Defluviitaleaceae bacterium]|nr:TetR/AcrR family transcriptional regulator [Defluviitaleaceae bacterium]